MPWYVRPSISGDFLILTFLAGINGNALALPDAEFDHFLDQWVVTAESSQYVRGA